jgi:pyruvate,orthophosphate dikinase
VRYVYAFDHDHGRPPRELADQLGGKGANLAEMVAGLGLPVPPGFTITTDACREFRAHGWPEGLDAEIDQHLRTMEQTVGRRLGDPDDPLLVSVRSGARASMPGMMDTVLNLGLGDAAAEGLALRSGDERFAFDSYRRFVALYARVVLGLPAEPFDAALEEAKEAAGVGTDAGLGADAQRELCRRYLEIVEKSTGSPLPQDPRRQLRAAVEAVFRSWDSPRAVAYRRRERIPDDLGTAVNVQAMVFGNRDDRSGTGVAFSRDPATGERRPYGDVLVNAQGEDVVAGIRATQPLEALADRFPDLYRELLDILARLEAHHRDMCDTEFTIEQGRLWMLQTRVGKRTGAAAVRMAVEMATQDEAVHGWRISTEEALVRVTAEHVEALLHPDFAVARESLDVLVSGLPASPGAGVGRAYLSAQACVDAAARGERVILVRPETSPEDIHGMEVAEAILTSRGGLVSHAAVVARGWGIPAVVGAAALEVLDGVFRVGTREVAEGSEISVSGTEGIVVLGRVPTQVPEASAHLDTLLGWADAVREGRVAVRANADTAADAAAARDRGAEGIGLCRTEHMFLNEERLAVVRRMILAEDPDEEAAALAELGAVQRADFAGVLEAMDGCPVTVRLLDPPLHEFLPPLTELLLARERGDLDPQREAILEAAERWREHNPMLGARGVRLGVLKPGLYAMQVRSLVGAARDRLAAGGQPVVEIMIPLTIAAAELAEARRWVTDAIAEAAGPDLDRLAISVGTMIETPRAALRAGDLAAEADFFSIGTNDLTQMTLGLSRDDVSTRVLPAYLSAGLLPADPFATLDVEGVGELVRMAVERGRAARPGLHVGVCGEHAGDPASIGWFVSAGVDYVSCSPYRVPIARLGVAQALLAT